MQSGNSKCQLGNAGDNGNSNRSDGDRDDESNELII